MVQGSIYMMKERVMSPVDVVKTFITALQAGEMEEAAQYMTDDFVERGWTPQPLEGQPFLAMMSALHNALPDFSYHLSETSQRGEEVEAFISITGSHTRDLALPEFGLPLIPYSGVAIQLPQTRTTFRVKGDAIAEMLVEFAARWRLERITPTDRYRASNLATIGQPGYSTPKRIRRHRFVN